MPGNNTKIKIGSRASALALWQAERVKTLLEQSNPGITGEIVKISTSGDYDRTTPLEKMGGVGVFVKELEKALQEGYIDIAVHSAKDLPSRLPPGFDIAAAPERGPVEDVLICRDNFNIDTLPVGSVIATGSPRRRAFIRSLRRDLKFCDVRGNIDTRIRKLNEGQFDGLVLAKAGIERLNIDIRYSIMRPPDIFLPAPGQGIIVVEGYRPNKAVKTVLASIDNPLVRCCLEAEQQMLRTLDAGCSSAVGGYCRWDAHKDELIMDGGILVENTDSIHRAQEIKSIHPRLINWRLLDIKLVLLYGRELGNSVGEKLL